MHKVILFIDNNLHKIEALSRREREVLTLIAQQKTTIQISAILKIRPSTVDTHRKNLIHKLELKSSMGLAIYGFLFSL
jgi:DNA-binding CsgD family transcriptional regulator